MTSNEWNKLCKNIYERRCILFIGSEFPIEKNEAGNIKETTFSDLLTEKLSDEISSFGRGSIYNCCDEKMELSQVATDYLKCSSEPIPRQELEGVIENYLEELMPDISSPVFENLMQLPFNFIVDTNFSDFFSDRIKSVENKYPRHSFYHFKDPKANPDNIPTDDGENIGTEARPYVYNIFGSIEQTQSIAISENELIEWLTNVISHHPPIPANIKNLLKDSNYCFLFIGFGFASKDWFFRILLHTLGSINKQLTSYATQSLNTSNNSSLVFFKVGLKVSIYPYDHQHMFISDLIKNYRNYEKKEIDNNKDIKVQDGAPTAFISYKNENYNVVKKISDRLRQNNINTWLDKERLTGKWNDKILEQIESSNTFLLMQSQELLHAEKSYVNREIDKAMQTSEMFRNKGYYFFPCCIGESAVNLDNDYPYMKDLQKWTLSNGEEINTTEIDRLAGEIKKSVERIKNNKVLI